MKKYLPQYIAEFIGTFFLVFFACGAMILSQLSPELLQPFVISIVFGGVISVMIYATGHISGAHFNPAVTIAFWAVKRFPSQKILGYIVAQISGATLASLLHLFIWGSKHSFGMTSLSVGIEVGILLEFLMGFVLMFVIIAVATDSRAVGELAGIAIGSTVMICAFVFGPLTGASINPARSIGPAILAGDFTHLWIFIVFPILGAIVGAIVYEKIRCMNPNSSGDPGCC